MTINVSIRLMLILPTLVIIYWFWISPILRSKPSLKDYYAIEDSWFAALRLKLAGIKQRLVGVLMVTASVIVEIYDFIAPAVGAVDTTPLTSHLPSWAWPLIGIGGILLLNYLRSLSDRQHDETVTVLKDSLIENNVPVPPIEITAKVG